MLTHAELTRNIKYNNNINKVLLKQLAKHITSTYTPRSHLLKLVVHLSLTKFVARSSFVPKPRSNSEDPVNILPYS